MTENTFFDFWKQSQDSLYKNQSEWFDTWMRSDDPATNEFMDLSKKSWSLCEEQYRSWMKATENWFATDAATDSDAEEQDASEKLLFMLNPENFSRFGFDQMNGLFMKLVNGPEFADIGMMEKKFLKSGQDWLALCDASENYQSVLASAWNRAFKLYAEEFSEQSTAKKLDSKDLLQRWLEIAESELISTLRSTDFLEAQRNFFKTGTAYKVKQQELTELWCEAHGMPTRSEVDELHKIIYELRRDIRSLSQGLKQVAGPPAKQSNKQKPGKNTRTTPVQKSTQAKPGKIVRTRAKSGKVAGTGKK